MSFDTKGDRDFYLKNKVVKTKIYTYLSATITRDKDYLAHNERNVIAKSNQFPVWHIA